jgi:hypothetical protein
MSLIGVRATAGIQPIGAASFKSAEPRPRL